MPLSSYIPETEPLLQYLGLQDVSETEKLILVDKLTGHFSDLIMDTIVDNLSAEQIQEMEAILKLPDNKQDAMISELTARVPGLSASLEFAIQQELEVLKESYQRVRE